MTLYIYGESAIFPVNLCENKEVVMKIVIVGCGKVGHGVVVGQTSRHRIHGCAEGEAVAERSTEHLLGCQSSGFFVVG